MYLLWRNQDLLPMKAWSKMLYPFRLSVQTSFGTWSHCSVSWPSSSSVTCTYEWSFKSFAAFCTLLWSTILITKFSQWLSWTEWRVWEILSTSSLNTEVYIRMLFVLHSSSVREVVQQMRHCQFVWHRRIEKCIFKLIPAKQVRIRCEVN